MHYFLQDLKDKTHWECDSKAEELESGEKDAVCCMQNLLLMHFSLILQAWKLEQVFQEHVNNLFLSWFIKSSQS